eukprot:TRINITY_DN1755_c0_g1_i8.p1 TRINITY_DN1755_c0_g1~~TRINITY_DN1755_c0_g1_i8.p1  ORF type:complete len:199 (-),score=37.40 TRINITY_DN1755_c0_g1_i8:145-741(-)
MQLKKDTQYSMKMLLLGDSGVGKTAVIKRFVKGVFIPNYVCTIGIDYEIQYIFLNGKKVKLQIWDTAGQERFRTITRSLYKIAEGIILVYDCTKQESFENVHRWIKQIENHSCPDTTVILIGNKSDSVKKVVDEFNGQELADHYKIKFFETSAKENKNINEAFYCIANDVLQKKSASETQLDAVHINSKSKIKGWCCR